MSQNIDLSGAAAAEALRIADFLSREAFGGMPVLDPKMPESHGVLVARILVIGEIADLILRGFCAAVEKSNAEQLKRKNPD